MSNERIRTLARSLRRNETQAEKILWTYLRSKKLDGVKFRRQQSIGDFVVDFASFERRLIVEIDGGQHSQAGVAQRDAGRTNWLESQGFRVLHFWNTDVLTNTDGVVSRIEEALLSSPSSLPSPIKEEGANHAG